MKKLLTVTLLALSSAAALASETVEINKTKYTKYSDSEVREFIVKMNSIQPDMSVDQVLGIMGRPIREQLVSASPPQRILVYPLSIVISLYQNSRSRQWQVTTPALYGSPLCQREDGVPVKNAIGAAVIDYPNITCIPSKFGPPQAKSALPSTSAAKWELLKTYPANGNGPGSSDYVDTKPVESTPTTKTIRRLSSYAADTQSSRVGVYRSMVTLTTVSCEPSKLDSGNLFDKVTEYYSGEMGSGKLIKSTSLKKSDEADSYFWSKDYDGTLTKKVCP